MAAGRMKAAIFVEPGRIVLDEKPIPDVGPLVSACSQTRGNGPTSGSTLPT